MKKLFRTKSFIWTIVLFMIIIGATSITACNKIDDKEINQNILNKVTEIEKSAHELNTLKITYDEYTQRTDKYLSKYFKSFYNPELIMYAYTLGLGAPVEKDWKGMPLDEIKKIGEPLILALSGHSRMYFYTSFDVSKVFDDNSSSNTSLHYKHIFIRYILPFDNEDFTGYKRYIFKREGDDYVLFSIRSQLVEPGEELTYGEEKVEFPKNIKL